MFWELAIEGKEGVKNIFNTLKTEFELALRLSGYSSIKELREYQHKLLKPNNAL